MTRKTKEFPEGLDLVGQPIRNFNSQKVHKNYRDRWLISGGNPRRRDTWGHACMEIIVTQFNGCCSTAEYFRHRGRSRDLRHDINHGNVWISKPGEKRPSATQIYETKEKYPPRQKSTSESKKLYVRAKELSDLARMLSDHANMLSEHAMSLASLAELLSEHKEES